MTCFEDLGDGDEEGEEEAKEALVFMLVGVREHWKAPIGYFLTKGLTAGEQKQLLLLALFLLAERGITVLSVVMDGHGTNVGMFGLLGGSLREDELMEMKTSFRDPTTGKEVFMMFDACHMLKLIRNMLHSNGVVQFPDGPVCWKYVDMLHKYQQDAELRIASGIASGELLFQPRLPLLVSTIDSGIARPFRCLQFPVNMSFATTINRYQGQTEHRVGRYSATPSFTHSQLCVALSRVGSFDAVEVPASHYIRTRNAAYRERL
ncbi:DNA transposase THAP9 [Amphibalanus amphitrite]|uniref:DNA transposase THAP9 n=1 Tax=Amphibalanus amphitrite TaxID=1232801 RepID=A0A6A4V989_AMPAM|nr:DNA transposase THAP9 [Amphibalanus amphitrite]